ncbi:Uma2 family endonuclease [Microcoleus sp.]|uniref:Uma2 family endonuclease n=1 Tax=Microcoleus sp. TaxID=44472 RepID=UPI00352339AC
MIQALPKLVNFEEFVERLPENSAVRYELHNGDIVEMAQPVGEHEEVISFLSIEIPVEIKRLGLPYGIPCQVIVRPPEKDSGYFPDVFTRYQALAW